jgi:hypothetical protein
MLLLATQALPQMQEFAHPNLGRLLTPRHFWRIADTLAEGWPTAADNDCFNGYSPEAIAAMFAKITPWPSLFARLRYAWPHVQVGKVRTADGQSVPEIEHAIAEPLPSLPSNLLWVAVPDVLRCTCGADEFHRKDERGPDCGPVGDADATFERFHFWHPWICHLPLAFVLQDGSERPGRVPWNAPGLAGVFVGGSDQFKLSADAAGLVREARRRGLYAHMGRVNSEARIQYARSIDCTSVDGSGWTVWRNTNLPRGLAATAAARPKPVHWQTRLSI